MFAPETIAEKAFTQESTSFAYQLLALMLVKFIRTQNVNLSQQVQARVGFFQVDISGLIPR